MKRLLDFDYDTGIETYFEFDHDQIRIERIQDVQPFLEFNKNMAADDSIKRAGIKDSWMHAARIPTTVIESWLKEGIDVFNKDHWPQVKRKLNDPNWKYLKTISGTI